MTTYKKIIALSLSAFFTVGALMTTPEMPSQNSGGLDLPAAIAGVPVNGVVARIGRVVDIVEATSITVEISGSDVLVNASYLFPQYEPMMGDWVYVAKQDAQWAVLGTLSGDINSQVANPSFEEGEDATLPSSWSFVVNSSAAGTPTFRKETGLGVHGNHIGIFRNSSAGVPGTSSGTATSLLIPAVENQKWALSLYVTFATPDVNAALELQGGNIQLTPTVQFFDSDGVFITGTDTNFIPFYSDEQKAIYLRTFLTASGGTPYVVTPPGTAFVRARIFVSFTMHANCASEIGIDLVLLRSI